MLEYKSMANIFDTVRFRTIPRVGALLLCVIVFAGYAEDELSKESSIYVTVHQGPIDS